MPQGCVYLDASFLPRCHGQKNILMLNALGTCVGESSVVGWVLLRCVGVAFITYMEKYQIGNISPHPQTIGKVCQTRSQGSISV